MLYLSRKIFLACMLCGLNLTLSFPSYSQVRYFKGYILSPKGSEDCNPCVQDVIQAVNTLRDHGETLGFNWGDNYPPVRGSGTNNHWQGIQRLPIFPGTGLDVPHFVVSSSHGFVPIPLTPELPAHFAVVEFASRDSDGLRLHSNRLDPGRLTRDVAPNPSDRIVKMHEITKDYNHPGGMQAIGKYLLVGSDTSIGHKSPQAIFSLWDMSQPRSPDLVWELPFNGNNANSVGIVRLEDGRYLIVRALPDAKELEFYIKRSSDLRENNWDLWDYWNRNELQTEIAGDASWASSCAGYQNTNVVTDCRDGKTYLIASHGRCPFAGESGDFVDAFRLDIPIERPANQSNYRDPGVGVIITKVARRHMFPGGNAGTRQGDFQAAAGAYISPDNKLYFYATEHGRTGPDNTVNMIEFGPQIARSEVKTLDEAWVELYAGDGFRGKSIILDYVDREVRDYGDFANIEQFVIGSGNTIALASSVIYAIPVGYRLRLYEGRGQTGPYFDLNGTGRAERIPSLSDVKLSDGRSASDKFRSAEWNGGQASEVWVDFGLRGSKQDGSFDYPYSSLNAGLAGVLTGGILKIKSGSSGETLTLTKAVTIEASGCPAIIGKR